MHNNAPPVSIAVATNVPLCSGCGIDHLYKDYIMWRAPIDASNPRTTSLNLLGIKHGCIAQVSINAITLMQAKAITWALCKREREGQARTSQTPKPQNNPIKNPAIKVGTWLCELTSSYCQRCPRAKLADQIFRRNWLCLHRSYWKLTV